MPRLSFVVSVLIALAASLALADDAPEWPDNLVSHPRVTPRFIADVGNLLGEKHNAWSNRWPHIVSVLQRKGDASTCVPLLFNADATQITFDTSAITTTHLIIETAERSQQYPDGTIIFVASDGVIHSPDPKPRAFFEDHKGNYRIGGWVNTAEFVTWPFKATRWGMYDVQITYSLAGGESDLTLDFGDKQVTGTIKSTDTWYRYLTVPFGRVYLDTAGEKTVKLAAARKTGGAVMNIKAIILRPAPEGADWPLRPGDDGVVALHAKDALVDGVTLRYEPKPEKNCLGFWSNPNDHAHWQFTAPAGEYDIEIHQGCGKGQGGSEVNVKVNDESHTFTVEDTGHFQNFKPRIIGRVKLADTSPHALTVIPITKAKAAVMDVRQIRLIPVKD